MSSTSIFSSGGDWRELSIGIAILVGLQLLAVLIVRMGGRMERRGIQRRQFSDIEKQAERVREQNAIAERVERSILPTTQTDRERDINEKINQS
jgi:hypothetical protein